MNALIGQILWNDHWSSCLGWMLPTVCGNAKAWKGWQNLWTGKFIHPPWTGECSKPWMCEYKRSEWINIRYSDQVLTKISQITNWMGEFEHLKRWMKETLNRWILSSDQNWWMLGSLNGWIQTPWAGECLKPWGGECLKTWAGECLKPWMGENKHPEWVNVWNPEQVLTNTLSGWMFETLSRLTGWNPEWIDWKEPWAGWLYETLRGFIGMRLLNWFTDPVKRWRNETLNGWMNETLTGEGMKPDSLDKNP